MEQITRKTPLKEVLKVADTCIKCGNCCRHTSGFLAGDDLKSIAKHFDMLPEDAKKQFMDEVEVYNKKFLKPKTEMMKNGIRGQCIFLGEDNGCKIHEVKPLQCRIGVGCKEHGRDTLSWFILNYCVDDKDPETIREYAHYLRAGGKVIPGGSLRELVKDEKMLKKILGSDVLKEKI